MMYFSLYAVYVSVIVQPLIVRVLSEISAEGLAGSCEKKGDPSAWSCFEKSWQLPGQSTSTVTTHSDICNIVKIGKISQLEFLDTYAYKEPVVFTNITDNSLFQSLCEKQRLIDDYGHKTVTLSTANTHSYDKVEMKFGEYVERVLRPQDFNKSGQDTLYFFGNHDYSEWGDLFDQYVIPPYELPFKSAALSFGIAGAGTGVPFHFHGPGFAEVIHGSKRWFLLPFENKPHFDPNKTTLRWLLEDYQHVNASEKIYECVLKPGEIIYFPDKWWHATLNVEASVFMSTFLG
ncbi:unnamed protein product [Clavelina lepadiformis]|uniref:JmjC domain-containing protein n=1 Tax=Clavelina lepadiformis TaxID=159417 RepID=A0ABP0GTM1_CLALP